MKTITKYLMLCIVAVASIVSCTKNNTKTPVTSNEFKISVEGITHNSANVVIECTKSQELPYFWTVIEKDIFQNEYSSDVANVVNKALEGKEPADITVKGRTESAVADLKAETAYIVIAVTVNEEGKCMNDSNQKEFATIAEDVSSDMTFEFNVTGVTQSGIVAEIIPSNNEDKYYFGISKSSEYAGAEKEVEEYISDFIANNPDADKADALRMVLRSGKISYSFSSLDAATEYTIFAIGMTDDGKYTTAEATHKESTLQEELKFTITVLNITASSAEIYYKPSRTEDLYFCGYMSEADYYSQCEGSVEGIAGYVEKYITENGGDINELCHTGNYQETVENLDAETKYYVYAAAVTSDGEVTGAAYVDNFTTKANQTFDFEVTSTTENSISYKVTTNDHSSTYYTSVITKAEFDTIGEEGIIEMVKENGDEAAANLNTGSTYHTAENLEPGTEYCIFALGFSSDKVVTSAVSHKFIETKTSETPACTFEIEMLSIDSKSAKVRFTPSDLNFGYIRNCIAVEDLDGQPSEEVIAQAALAYLESQVGGYYSTFEDVLRVNTWTGVNEKTFVGQNNQISPMVAGKEYVAFAVGFDNNKNQTCELHFITFTLPTE